MGTTRNRIGPLVIAGFVVLLGGCGGRTTSAVVVPSSAGSTVSSAMLNMPNSISPGLVAAPPMAQTPPQPASAMTSLRRPASNITPLGFTQLPGAGVFVAASPDGSIWVLSTQGGPVDKSIYHYVNGTWTNIPGAAMRLAVGPDNTLWAVNSLGGIYSYKNGAWSTIAGGASDIAVGADGSVYVISSVAGGQYGNGIWHYLNGAWTQLPGAGMRIAASWDTGSYSYNVAPGGFYVVNAQLSLFSYNPQFGFTQIPGAAIQLAPTTDGGLFVLGVPTSSNGNPIYYNNLVTGTWTQQAGAGVSIATNSSNVYVIGAAGGIYQAPVTSPSTGNVATDVYATLHFAYQNPPVALYSDISQAYTNLNGAKLTLIWNYFSKLFAKSYGGHAYVYYTQSQSTYAKAYADCGGGGTVPGTQNTAYVESCYDPTTGVQALVMMPTYLPDDSPRLQHEVSHQFLYATYPASQTNPWIKEGTGMYWESGTFDPSGNLVVTTPQPGYVAIFKQAKAAGTTVSLSTLVNLDANGFYNGLYSPTNGTTQSQVLYAQAMLVVSYLFQHYPSVMTGLIAQWNGGSISTNQQTINYITGQTSLSLAQLDAAYTAYAMSL